RAPRHPVARRLRRAAALPALARGGSRAGHAGAPPGGTARRRSGRHPRPERCRGARALRARAERQRDHRRRSTTLGLAGALAALGASIFASILSVLVSDYFFTRPFYSLRMTDPQDYLSLGTFLIVAVLTSQLTARVRDQAEAARRREGRAAALYAFGRAITGAATIDELGRAIALHVDQAHGAAAARLLPDR